MSRGIRGLIPAACLASGLVPATTQAADAALVYDKNYQCGDELIQVGSCRRDSDMPGNPPTTDAENYCQVYYPSRPKNAIGGTAFGIELRSDLEKMLRACGAIGDGQPAVAPLGAPPAAPAGRGAEGLADQGNKYFAGKDYAKAVESYRKAIAADPRLARAYQGLALAQRELKQYPQAIATLRQLIELRPGAAMMKDALAVTATTHLLLGQVAEAQLAAGRLKNMDAERGQKLFDSINRELSKRAANDEITRGTRLFESKQYPQALAAFQAALPLAPDDETAALAYRWIGTANRVLERYDQAIAALREALRRQPADAGTLFSLGWVYHLARRYPEALATLEKSLRLAPDDAETHYWVGEVNLVGLERPQEALTAYQNSLRYRPDDARTINQMGLAYSQMRRYESAILAFQRAVKLKPGNALYYSNLALGYAYLDRFDDARGVAQSLRKVDARKAEELEQTLAGIKATGDARGESKP